MEAKKSLSALEGLRKDASQVMENLTDLSKKIALASKSKSDDFSKEVANRFEDDIEKIKVRVESLNRDASKLVRQMDGHLRKNPYVYVIGALALGALVGKLSSPRAQ